MPEDLAASRVGQTIGNKWKLERLLGEGGMAAVYAGVDPATGERAAVKVLHPEMTRRKDVRERFFREAYVANRIAHPGAVRVLSHGHDSESYLVMELLEGEPLSVRAQRLSDFTVRELLGYANEILDVLAAAHDKGVIHRDIKPDNVFVTNERHAKILDFGIARVLDDVPQAFKTRTGLALGTVPYMAPEQALGRRGEVDGRSDLFALGALLFRILSGRRIHDEKSEAELLVAMATRPAPSLSDVAPNVPKHVSAVVDIALAFSRDARYPDARTMQADVQALLAGHRPPYASSQESRREAKTRVDQLIVAPAMSADSGTLVSQGHAAMQADSISAPTRVVGPAAVPPSQKVTAPLPAVEPPYSQRPGSQAIAMPMIDDLDALIMAPIPGAPASAFGATVPAGTAPPQTPMHDSAPPPAMPTAPAQFARSGLPEQRKRSSSVWFFVLAIFALGALIAIVAGALMILATQGTGDATAAPSTSVTASAVPSATPIPLDPTSSPAPEESASTSPVGTSPKAATTSKVKPATSAATSAPKTIAQPTARPSTTATPPKPSSATPTPTPTAAPTPPPPPSGPPAKGKDKDKDKGKGHH